LHVGTTREVDDLKVAVLGATGLVGRYVVEALVRADCGAIVGTFRSRPPYAAARTEWVSCDLREPGAAAAALGNADCAVLCAGQVSTSAVLRADPVNSVLDTLRIVTNALETASRVRLRRLVMIGSCTAYPALPRPAVEEDALQGDPPPQWFGVGWMHRYAEQQVRWHVEHLRRIGSAVVLRPTLIYGRHDDFSPDTGHFVPSLIAKVVDRARPIEIWGDGEQSRNLLHAGDLADAVLAVLDGGRAAFEAFNVVSPDDVTVNAIVRHLLDIDGFAGAEVRHDLARRGGPAGLSVSGEAFRELTGWRPRIGLRQGLSDTLEWYRRTRLAAAAGADAH
jgi:GDP-L-fucose synthase